MNVAVVIPVHRGTLTPDEEISLFSMRQHLSRYDSVIVKPESLVAPFTAQRVISFPDESFASVSSYSRLLLTAQFYESLIDYDYVLIYQLDCLVFTDDLQYFCELGYDYIGAPLFRRYQEKPVLSRVGNGGFSLRRIQAFLKVLDSERYIETTPPFLSDFLTADVPDLDEWSIYQRWLKKMRVMRSVRRGVTLYLNTYTMNEDLFWSDRAKLFFQEFRIAPMSLALKFAFDKYPRTCFELNNYQLPLGAHAWAKWDRTFWEQYLQK